MVIEKINDLFSGDHPDSGVNNAEIPQKPMGELVPIVYRALKTSAERRTRNTSASTNRRTSSGTRRRLSAQGETDGSNRADQLT